MRQDNYPAGVDDAVIAAFCADPEVPRGATCGGCRFCKAVTDWKGQTVMRVCAWCPMQGDWDSGMERVGEDRQACPEWEAA